MIAAFSANQMKIVIIVLVVVLIILFSLLIVRKINTSGIQKGGVKNKNVAFDWITAPEIVFEINFVGNQKYPLPDKGEALYKYKESDCFLSSMILEPEQMYILKLTPIRDPVPGSLTKLGYSRLTGVTDPFNRKIIQEQNVPSILTSIKLELYNLTQEIYKYRSTRVLPLHKPYTFKAKGGIYASHEHVIDQTMFEKHTPTIRIKGLDALVAFTKPRNMIAQNIKPYVKYDKFMKTIDKNDVDSYYLEFYTTKTEIIIRNHLRTGSNGLVSSVTASKTFPGVKQELEKPGLFAYQEAPFTLAGTYETNPSVANAENILYPAKNIKELSDMQDNATDSSVDEPVAIKPLSEQAKKEWAARGTVRANLNNMLGIKDPNKIIDDITEAISEHNQDEVSKCVKELVEKFPKEASIRLPDLLSALNERMSSHYSKFGKVFDDLRKQDQLKSTKKNIGAANKRIAEIISDNRKSIGAWIKDKEIADLLRETLKIKEDKLLKQENKLRTLISKRK